MGITKEIERARKYPQRAPQSFRDQIERAQAARDNFGSQAPAPANPKGIDRSGELAPLPRPVIVRTLARGREE
jgi:hypothetical protein